MFFGMFGSRLEELAYGNFKSLENQEVRQMCYASVIPVLRRLRRKERWWVQGQFGIYSKALPQKL